MSVKSGYANSSSQSLVQCTYESNSTQKWKINWTASGQFILRPMSGEAYSTDWCMSYGTFSSIPHGISLRQNGYVSDNNYDDEWLLLDVGDFKGLLTYWNSTGTSVGYWDHTPGIYIEQKVSNNNFYFAEGVSTALNQWEDALDSSYYATDEESANIRCYGLNADQYFEMTGECWAVGTTGRTDYDHIFVGYAIYGNEVKEIDNYLSATIFIVHNSNDPRPLNDLKKTITHEFGHALGYRGHSPTTSDVMYAYAHSNYTLSTSEKNHLRQIYVLMMA